MGYMHINNLYKDQRILAFRECYALEKVHGTSAHVRWTRANPQASGSLTFFSGGEKHESFVKLFDFDALDAAFLALGHARVTIYGEAYGGKCMGMRNTYGDSLRFIAFDVQIGESWLSVMDAEQVCSGLGLEFVPYHKVPTDIVNLDAERDRPSEVAVRRGCGGDKPREGVVLRPPFEVRTNNDERIIVKYKGDAFEERKTPQKVVSPEKLAVLVEAKAVVDEWVTEMRLTHVLDKLPDANDVSDTHKVIAAMIEDVTREASGLIIDTKEVRQAIGRRAAELFRVRIRKMTG